MCCLEPFSYDFCKYNHASFPVTPNLIQWDKLRPVRHRIQCIIHSVSRSWTCYNSDIFTPNSQRATSEWTEMTCRNIGLSPALRPDSEPFKVIGKALIDLRGLRIKLPVNKYEVWPTKRLVLPSFLYSCDMYQGYFSDYHYRTVFYRPSSI